MGLALDLNQGEGWEIGKERMRRRSTATRMRRRNTGTSEIRKRKEAE
jgi:hypothetical protein